MTKLLEFLKGSVEELKKASWPSKDEVVRASAAVFVFVAVFSALLFGMDWVVRVLLQGLLR